MKKNSQCRQMVNESACEIDYDDECDGILRAKVKYSLLNAMDIIRPQKNYAR